MRRIGPAVAVALSLVLAPLAAETQQARQGTRVPRVGFILANHPTVIKKDDWAIQAFLAALRKSG
jgi:hypothetical protein